MKWTKDIENIIYYHKIVRKKEEIINYFKIF